ncbi:hypothetical protein BS47DRAFT_1377626 [Hydnum rufescens UP504]|uniref:Nitrite reductase [NAD(P)H] n=1 Tax=Hydnum rufescens UP504 TaxID=1448309 RepID=A0A9P6DNP5_9AGAM|nr:hypothetical protein BS47DRAFT_1377626 [Hydnum rufescens UP504]
MVAPHARKTVVVAGLGMVGIEETHLAYNRVALTDYFQHRSVDKLYLNGPEWYQAQSPEHFASKSHQSMTAAHTITTSKNQLIKYDLASARATSTAGVFVYRNLSDLDRLISYSEKDGISGGRACVIGGGLLGLEAAKAAYDLPGIKDVAIINRKSFPLSRQIDAEAGELVLQRIEALGVKVFTNCVVKDIITTTTTEGEVFSGLEFTDGTIIEAQIVIFAVGIAPREDLARASGIACHEKGGIIVNDDLKTSAEDVFAIGECASWRGQTYGLIGPGVEMADILSFNLTQTETTTGTFKPRKMNDPDLSTKLKLMGVDVASFGDFFAHERMKERLKTTPKATNGSGVITVAQARHGRKHRSPEERPDEPIKCLTYKDPFASVYKKWASDFRVLDSISYLLSRYIFSADGKYLLGGIMIGDVRDYVKLVAIVKKKKTLEVPPSEFIVASANDKDDDGADLDDDTQVCSCHNVIKGAIVKAVAGGCSLLGDLKAKTKAGTGCGGCMPLVTNIFKAELTKAGMEVSNSICPHFSMSRVDLFNVIKIKRLKDFNSIMKAIGVSETSIGCETCKPAVASILSSLYNDHVMTPAHHQNQDTNDRYLANIQRNGTFSVIPRISAGEITPEGLIAIGQVAKKYGLYTKITGGQRIDMFGAQKQDLPSIWAELVEAGFQSGHAYGKALRTVKSCVGTTWCRYGVGDSVGLAVQLEERYKSVRAPHKLKGGVSGCVRECAEAQSKDFGLIATDKGWNLFVAGNGGASPKHATLFATDVPPSRVVRLIDRYIMFYIRTADKLQRTARWMESFEGGIERLKKILIDDELGICKDLENEMDALVGTYACEWTEVVNNPERQKQFRQFVNTDERIVGVENIVQRKQQRPADWPKAFPGVKIGDRSIHHSRDEWTWRPLAKVSDLTPSDAYATSAAVKYGDSQLAIFHVPRKGYYATQQMCPHKRAFVLDHGLVGDDSKGNVYVSCPLHKRNFKLDDGECLNDSDFAILAFEVKEEDGFLLIKLPESDELDGTIGTSKWMVRNATAEAINRGAGAQIEIVGPDGRVANELSNQDSSCAVENAGAGCGNTALDW